MEMRDLSEIRDGKFPWVENFGIAVLKFGGLQNLGEVFYWILNFKEGETEMLERESIKLDRNDFNTIRESISDDN